MFANELKESTWQVHQALEKRLVSQIKSIGGVDDYVHLLRMMYGFYAPVCDKLGDFIKHEQRHAGKILDDISYFTGSDKYIPINKNLPKINSYPSALGVMYVTEGSTLGGVIIAGMISKKLGVSSAQGFSFFNAYGEQTQSRWHRFREILAGPFTSSEHNEIKESAIATFSSFNEWISEYEPATHK